MDPKEINQLRYDIAIEKKYDISYEVFMHLLKANQILNTDPGVSMTHFIYPEGVFQRRYRKDILPIEYIEDSLEIKTTRNILLDYLPDSIISISGEDSNSDQSENRKESAKLFFRPLEVEHSHARVAFTDQEWEKYLDNAAYFQLLESWIPKNIITQLKLSSVWNELAPRLEQIIRFRPMLLGKFEALEPVFSYIFDKEIQLKWEVEEEEMLPKEEWAYLGKAKRLGHTWILGNRSTQIQPKLKVFLTSLAIDQFPNFNPHRKEAVEPEEIDVIQFVLELFVPMDFPVEYEIRLQSSDLNFSLGKKSYLGYNSKLKASMTM